MLCKYLMIIIRVRLQRMASCLPELHCLSLRILPIEPDRARRLSLRIISLVPATLLTSRDAGMSGAVQKFPGQEAFSGSVVTLLWLSAPSPSHGLAYVGMTNVHTARVYIRSFIRLWGLKVATVAYLCLIGKGLIYALLVMCVGFSQLPPIATGRIIQLGWVIS